MKVIVLTGGGTAGHCMPCFALLPDLKKKFDEIYYIGGKDKIESRLAKKHNVTFFYIPTVKLERRPTLKNTLIPFKLLNSVSSAKKLLENLKPTVVFSKGGYVSLPVVIAAHKLKIPVISHESDLTLGLANKIALRYSARLLTGFPETAEGIKKAEFTGIPLDKSLFIRRDKKKLCDKYKLDGRRKTLLVTGGSQGSTAINETVLKALPDLAAKYNVFWLTGKGKSEKSTLKLPENVYISEFSENMGEVYALSDACVSRAGANTLSELIALAIPTLAIPLPKGNSRGDQEQNAEYFRKKGIISVLKEEKLNADSLLYSVDNLFKKAENYSSACKKTDFRSANEKVISFLDFQPRKRS